MTKAGANATDLVGGDAGADTAAANEDAAFALTAEDSATDLFGEVGIVDSGGGVGANVEDLMALLFQALDDGMFQIVPCMVTAYGN